MLFPLRFSAPPSPDRCNSSISPQCRRRLLVKLGGVQTLNNVRLPSQSPLPLLDPCFQLHASPSPSLPLSPVARPKKAKVASSAGAFLASSPSSSLLRGVVACGGEAVSWLRHLYATPKEPKVALLTFLSTHFSALRKAALSSRS